MLSLDEPLSLSGLSIFRDFNNRAAFYYLPESPRLTVKGTDPMFQLLVYRRAAGAEGAAGGGFLTMTADLGVSRALIENVTAELSRRFGVAATLTPLPVESGSVRVSLLDSSSGEDERTGGFVEKILAASTPSLYGDQTAVFTSRLSQEGAVLMQAALQDGGASPVVLVYELTYRGLLPAYECTIKIHFDQSYDYLRSRATSSSLLLQTDVDSEMEELVKRGAIEISDIVYHTEDPEQQRQRRQELQQLAKDLATWSFFSPGLQPGKVLPENQRDLFAPPPNFEQLLQRNRQSVQTALQGRGTPAGAEPQRQGGTDGRVARPSGSTPQTTADPPREQPPVEPPTTSGVVDAWDRAGRPHGTFQLKQIQQRERQDIVFHLQQVTAATRTISPQGQIRLLGNRFDLRRQIKQVPLDADFFQKVQGTVTTTAPLAELGISSMKVEVRYGFRDDGGFPKDAQEFMLRQAGESHDFAWWLDARRTDQIEYRVTLNHIPDAAIGATAADEVSPWIKTTARHLDIDPRELSGVMSIRVEAGAIDWALVKQVQAEVRYEDPAARITANRIVKLEPTAPQGTVLVRPASSRSVRVVAKLVYADGGTDDVVLQREGSGVLLVNQPPSSIKSVTTVLADPLGRYEKVVVQLAKGGTGEPETDRALELRGDLAKETWSFRPSSPADRRFRYKVTYFVGGAVREEPWVTTSSDQLVVGDRADGVLRVGVTFLSDLQSAGMKVLRLTLRYPDAPEWADPDMQRAFTSRDAAAMSQPLEWRVPMRDRRATTYEYEMQWIRNDNTRLDVGPIKTNAESLLIDPLTPESVL